MTVTKSDKEDNSPAAEKRIEKGIKQCILIGLCGMAMMLTQYVAVREVGSTFFSTELVTLMAIVMALIGPTIAYAFAHRIGNTLVNVWAVLSISTALVLPVAVRFLVGTFAAQLWVLIAVLALGSLFLCGWFAIFLPRISQPDNFPELYAIEVGGALSALCLIALIPGWHALLCLYWTLLAVLVYFAVGRIGFTLVVLAASMGMSVMYPGLDDRAAIAYFEGSQLLDEPQIVDTVYSPYQRIDVVQSSKGRGLYLDGVAYYSKGDLDWFNTFIAELPGKLYLMQHSAIPAHVEQGAAAAQFGPHFDVGSDLNSHEIKRPSALVIGSGSFGSSGRLKRLGYEVTVVELDGEVARIGFKDFQDVHGLKQGDVQVAIDDARHYLSKLPKASYDLVILDLPAPFHVQTALLYTPEFYRQVKTALKPNGIASLNLCSQSLTDEIAGSIAKSASTVFANLTALKSNSNAGLWLVYATDNPAFSAEAVKEGLAQVDPRGGRVVSDRQLRLLLRNHVAHTQDRLLALLFLARINLPGAR